MAGRTLGRIGYTSPYFQYDGLEAVKWTLVGKYILFGASGLRGIILVRGLDNNSQSSEVSGDAEGWSPALGRKKQGKVLCIPGFFAPTFAKGAKVGHPPAIVCWTVEARDGEKVVDVGKMGEL